MKEIIKNKVKELLLYSTNLDGKLSNIIDNNLYNNGQEYFFYTKYIQKKYNKDNFFCL